MVMTQPATTIDPRFSDTGEPTPWTAAVNLLQSAEVYWLSTVRQDGRPHVTTLIAIWHNDALYFTTGAGEQKARNLANNPNVAVTTGQNTLNAEGLDVVIEGTAERITDQAALEELAQAYVAKYGEEWRFTVSNAAFHHGEHPPEMAEGAWVFRVSPTIAFGFGKGALFSQTRWRFEQ